MYHDPLISVKLGLISGTPGTSGPDWFFYVRSLPAPLTLLGIGLLLLGFVTKDWLKDRRMLLLGVWFLGFLSYYSRIENQDLRFMVEWAPPLFAIIGIGVSNSFAFLKTREIHIRRILAASMSVVVGIWLILLLLGSFAAEVPALSPAYYNGKVLQSVDGFQLSVSWLQQHMNETEIGVTDLAPYFSYYTHRFLYDWGYLLELQAANHSTIRDVAIRLHIKYAVFRDYFVQSNDINSLTFLVRVQGFNEYSIYQVAS